MAINLNQERGVKQIYLEMEKIITKNHSLKSAKVNQKRRVEQIKSSPISEENYNQELISD